MAKAYSNDLRCKLLTAYDRGQGSLRALAVLFSVSYDWAKKISSQRLRSQQMGAGRAKPPWRGEPE
jgi:transposase